METGSSRHPTLFQGMVDSDSGDWFVMLHDDNGHYELLDPGPSQRLRNHSPDGFSWGYGGSGPSQLALAMLLRASADPERSLAHYQDFKREVVARWPMDHGWRMSFQEVLGWLDGRKP